MSAEGRGIQSIEVGASLLEAIAEASEPIMLKDVAQAAGVPAAQAHTYLVSYRRCNLVEKDEQTGRYRLGPLALQLGLARLRGFDPLKAAGEAAAQFAADTGLSVVITVWGAYGPTVVQLHEGSDQIHIAIRPGTVFSMTGTATGRVFCALLSNDIVRDAVKAQKSDRNSARFVGALFEIKTIQPELKFIREHGYAIVASNPIPGISAISAPIFETGGELTGSVTIIGPEAALNLDPSAKPVRGIVALANSISARAGYQRPN